MGPILHGSLAERPAGVPGIEPVTCRQWLKRALFGLDNAGFTSLTEGVDDIEMGGSPLAEENRT